MNGDNNFSSRRGGPHTGRICKVRRVKTEISVLHTRLLPVTGHLGTANWRPQNRGCRHLCATKLPSSRHLCKCSSPPAAHSSSHLASPSASKTPQASALQFRRCYHAEDYEETDDHDFFIAYQPPQVCMHRLTFPFPTVFIKNFFYNFRFGHETVASLTRRTRQ